jgi:hypothetical protein
MLYERQLYKWLWKKEQSLECIVAILWVPKISDMGVKRRVLYKGDGLRLTISACYLWKMELNAGLDVSFDNM